MRKRHFFGIAGFRASRRRARGAVFVESIVVISMIMLLFAGGLFLHRLYSMKLKAMREARLTAWTGALQGCPTGLGLPGVASAVWSSIESLSTCDSPFGASCVVGGLTTSGTTNPPDWMGTSGASAPGPVTYTVTSDARLGGRTFRPSAQHRVACNETPQHTSGDLRSLVDYAHDSFWPRDAPP